MSKVAIIYGSTTDNTATVAKELSGRISGSELFNIADGVPSNILDFDLLILGASTWGLGELQDDWQDNIGDLAGLDLAGKKVAFFGLGDQEGYPDTFCDSVGLIKDELASSGAEFVGSIVKEGYSFDESRAEENGTLLGLLIDEDNESAMTDDRISQWLESMSTLLS
ncbi:flavodoxin [Salinispira pacifica]|nr:flavodoxin [Salinispira pacifica]